MRIRMTPESASKATSRRTTKNGSTQVQVAPAVDSRLDSPLPQDTQVHVPGIVAPEPKYLLRLYVAGVTARSSIAISNLKSICEEHLKGRYELDVVDIYQQPALAMKAQITAVPTLIRRLPPPLRRIVGDMSRKDRVLVGLDMLEQM